jgi:methionine synthase I (cobalamin-dependent)
MIFKRAVLNVTHPDFVVQAHSEFIDAGANVILTNTYQSNIKRLSKLLGNEEAVKFVDVIFLDFNC